MRGFPAEPFARFSAEGDGSMTIVNFTSYIDGLPWLSVTGARSCEKPITASEIMEAMNNCTGRKSSVLNALPYDFYVFITDLFGSLLADVYSNWR